ncbi:MAG: lipoate--protein ligase family protein [Bryobacterales bacterium]|nr:lipoate--protein ligase family protein [Bryobacterales bacterium]
MDSRGLAQVQAEFGDAPSCLKFEEELLRRGEAALWMWESAAECVVLGQSGRPERDTYVGRCEADGVPIVKRCSGGGAVLLGPGCLVYTLVLPLDWWPELRDVRDSKRWVMDRVRRALGVEGLTVEGISDLALDGRKVSGNAQRRSSEAILHHGTVLYGFDVSRMGRYLKMPHKEPEYRAGRGHEEFLANLPVAVEEIRRGLVEEFGAR